MVRDPETEWEQLVAWMRMRAEEVGSCQVCTLKVELTSFKNGLDVKFEKKRGVKDDYRFWSG